MLPTVFWTTTSHAETRFDSRLNDRGMTRCVIANSLETPLGTHINYLMRLVLIGLSTTANYASHLYEILMILNGHAHV